MQRPQFYALNTNTHKHEILTFELFCGCLSVMGNFGYPLKVLSLINKIIEEMTQKDI